MQEHNMGKTAKATCTRGFRLSRGRGIPILRSDIYVIRSYHNDHVVGQPAYTWNIRYERAKGGRVIRESEEMFATMEEARVARKEAVAEFKPIEYWSVIH